MLEVGITGGGWSGGRGWGSREKDRRKVGDWGGGRGGRMG